MAGIVCVAMVDVAVTVSTGVVGEDQRARTRRQRRTVVNAVAVAMVVEVEVLCTTAVVVGSVETPETTVGVGVGMWRHEQAWRVSGARDEAKRTEERADVARPRKPAGGVGSPRRLRGETTVVVEVDVTVAR